MQKDLYEELNRLKVLAYENSVQHGWHEEELSDSHFLVLVVTELCEAVQADRMNKRSHLSDFYDKKNPNLDKLLGFSSKWFGTFIKDSVEDELSDAVIRLLDLAGLRDFLIIPEQSSVEDIKRDKPFEENIYQIVRASSMLWCWDSSYLVNVVIGQIFRLANYMDIDLMSHIKLKMEYNKTREYKHGKRY